jgi:hypothetical protein
VMSGVGPVSLLGLLLCRTRDPVEEPMEDRVLRPSLFGWPAVALTVSARLPPNSNRAHPSQPRQHPGREAGRLLVLGLPEALTRQWPGASLGPPRVVAVVCPAQSVLGP